MLTVIDAAESYDLLSLNEAKAALNIAGIDQDAKLAIWIEQVSTAISTSTGRVFAVEKVAESFRPAHSRIGLVLARYPVISIDSIVECDATLTDDDYECDAESGVVNRLWRDRYAAWANSKVMVTYTAGFESIPADLKRAAIVCLQHMQSSDERDPAIRSRTVTDIEEIQYFAPNSDSLPAEAEALVKPYRMPKVG